ncbi:uncharacterized protein K444DRAFT_620164 [Hyaloscypha bicolor E]|uniref:Uncharacterized protein n=1 Tax=Hyaloscypha bicolor E TaxID=1095630 RepID=A0A2J6SJN5_9HELO|nr:uncharacterized protein K444DRAFT_620164 [Hyaloscypha bicolor E]PMD50981.1 hypothetical protein K444DRAFT_620164 [Hyaloscypha bicolor E]
MARLSNLPNNALLRDMPERDKLQETPATAARAYCIRNKDTVKKAWQRERKKIGIARALIQYAVSYAINGGKGATKQMIYNCAMWMQTEDNKIALSWK